MAALLTPYPLKGGPVSFVFCPIGDVLSGVEIGYRSVAVEGEKRPNRNYPNCPGF